MQATLTKKEKKKSPLSTLSEPPKAAAEISKRLFESEKDYRVAITQISTFPGRIRENTRKIVEYISAARKENAKIVVFPELTIPGYASMDLLYNKTYLARNAEALELIRDASQDITVIVGFVDTTPNRTRAGGRPILYNSAAVIHDRQILGIQDKTLLPNYDIFFEDRYFSPPRNQQVFNVNGVKLAPEICEDLWSDGYQVDPSKQLVEKGADILINLSASPFHIGKLPTRIELIKKVTQTHKIPFIYANLVGCFDGFEGEVVFDGRSIAMAAGGKLIGIGDSFKEQLLVVDLSHPKEIQIPNIPEVNELHDALVLGIRDYFERLGRSRSGKLKCAFIGLSGGIDSAVVAALAVTALGPENVIGLTMPSRFSSSETKGDAKILAENLGIKFKTVPIEEQYKVSLDTLRQDSEIQSMGEDVSEENIQARLRMINLMYYANKFGGITLNTGNKTELALNNCTIYGDMVGGFSVLGDVDKDRIYALAHYINDKAGRDIIPLATITRPPSAELKPNQTDDMVMGAMPQIISPLIRGIIENGLTLIDALKQFQGQFSEGLIRRSFKLLDQSEWKRRQAAPAIRVTPRAFGMGRRVPMGHGFEE